jgi:VWFA-related protein
MRMTLSNRLALALATAASVAMIAGPSSRARAQAGDRERTLFVSALDEKGEPVTALAPDDVIVREDGVRREVLRISRATEPIDIALLIDNSASAEDAITHMRDAIRRFITRMAGSNQIAMVALADRPTILVDYTSDQKRLEAGIGRLFPMSMSGMTMLDAIVEVSRGLARRETPRVAIVPVINDGVEFTNRYSRDVTEALKMASAPLHAVTVGSFQIGSDEASRERAYVLDQGTRESGGQRVTLLSPMGLNTALDKLARELSSQHKVVYGRPQSLIPPEKLEITSARRGVTLRGAPMRGQAGA